MTRRLPLAAAAVLLLHLVPGSARAEATPVDPVSAPRRLDAKLLGGLTASDGRADAGVRFAEVAVEPRAGLRAWLQYDGSLGLDSAALARRGVTAPAVYGGGLVGWSGGHVTRLEVGGRSLEGERQVLVRGEQVFALPGARFAKGGAWVAVPAGGRAEAVGHAALSFPAGRSLRLEPTVFAARTAVAGERDVRLLLSADLQVGRGVVLGGAAGAGRSWGRATLPDGTLATAAARASFPLRGPARGEVLATHERPASGPSVTVFAAGVSVTTSAK